MTLPQQVPTGQHSSGGWNLQILISAPREGPAGFPLGVKQALTHPQGVQLGGPFAAVCVAAAWLVGGSGFGKGCRSRSVLTAYPWTCRGMQGERGVLSQMESDPALHPGEEGRGR